MKIASSLAKAIPECSCLTTLILRDDDDLLRMLTVSARHLVIIPSSVAGMQYERMMFGMKISDASSLAKAIPECSCLTTLILRANLIDDDLLHILTASACY